MYPRTQVRTAVSGEGDMVVLSEEYTLSDFLDTAPVRVLLHRSQRPR